MVSEMKKIAVMGGTFDPVHYGHLVTAEEAYHHFELDKVIFVPSGMPPHKRDGEVSCALDRYNMTVMATEDNPHFEVSSCEVDKDEFSYTVDTIRYFNDLYHGDKLYFVVGTDALLEMHTWRRPYEILDMCELIVATRPGYELSAFDSEFLNHFSNKINVFEIPALDISSTDIRERIRGSRPVKYLLPDRVADYIRSRGLYL